MISDFDFTPENAFEIIEPDEARVPFVFNSPHSGSAYPTHFLEASRLTSKTIRKSEDVFVDELFQDMPALGAPLIRALFPRAYLDVNREPYELDPKMFDEALPSYANVRSIRVAGGLGTIARMVSENHEIYKKRLSLEDALNRIETLYKPYHARLRKLLARTHVNHGEVYLIDCHSMPSGSAPDTATSRPDFVLGDRYGTSCAPELTTLIGEQLAERGYTVNRNKPYAGGFITEHYGRPSTGLHALQIEINRGIYANEAAYTKKDSFNGVRADLEDVFKNVFDIFGATTNSSPSLAAE